MEDIGPSSSSYCCASPISSSSRHASNSSTDDQSTSSDLFSGQSSQPTSPIPSSSDDKRMDREQKECGEDLREHCWYWGAATKEQISAAMENQPNGTFSIRDASTKGQFTLTLRIDGTNKLIKIMVEKDKCGFTPDCLDFESIADLVQFYRTCSLRDFNERLDTCLLHPLISPDWQNRQQHKLIGGKSKSKMLDPVYRVSLLKCRLEGLHAEYDRISRRYDQLFSQQSSLADEHKRKQQTAKAYSDALKVFQRKIGELKKTMTEVMDLNDRDQEALAMNVELQEERMEEIGKAQSLMQNAIQNIGQTLIKIAEELEELKPKLLKLHKKRDKCRDKLLAMPKRNQSQQQITHAQLDRLIQGVSIALDSEPISLSAFLLRTPLRMPKWDCENWLWHSATKDQSIAFIRALIQRGDQSDGIFLIRPSTSRPGFYALEISKDGNVHSCLIEYRDPRTAPIDHNGGYGFAQTQMLFSSLVDFVRYYSVVPLKEHNTVLDTPLISPALGLHKKMERKKNAGKFIDENNGKEEAIKLGKDDEK